MLLVIKNDLRLRAVTNTPLSKKEDEYLLNVVFIFFFILQYVVSGNGIL